MSCFVRVILEWETPSTGELQQRPLILYRGRLYKLNGRLYNRIGHVPCNIRTLVSQTECTKSDWILTFGQTYKGFSLDVDDSDLMCVVQNFSNTAGRDEWDDV